MEHTTEHTRSPEPTRTEHANAEVANFNLLMECAAWAEEVVSRDIASLPVWESDVVETPQTQSIFAGYDSNYHA